MSQPDIAAQTATESSDEDGALAAAGLSGGAFLLVWLISITLHGVGLLIMFLVVFPYTSKGDDDVPVSRVDMIGPLDAKNVVTPPAPELTDTSRKADPLARLKPKPSEDLSELAVAKKPELSIIGIGSGGADFSKHGLTAGAGEGPSFFGLGGSERGVREVVYVVDRSGSMMYTFPYVKEELTRSINRLRRSQKFHVVFFNAGPPLENPPRKLVSAIRAQKEAFFRFLRTLNAEGSTHPERAMRLALGLKPDLIYMLTDGEFDERLIERLNRWNEDRKVKIYTIAFLDSSGAELLRQIAYEHGGEFRFVSEHDLP